MTLAVFVKTKLAFVLGAVFSFFLCWWLVVNFFSSVLPSDPDLFADTYAVVALFGGLVGVYLAFAKWGGWGSVLGKVIMLLSIGLLAQVFGQFSYAYYARVLGVEVPYPSIGDIGFYGSMFFYIAGAYYLVKLCAGVTKVSKATTRIHPLVLLIPLSMLATAYLVFIKDYEFDPSDRLITLLDFTAPLLQSVYVSLALVAFYFTRDIVNGIMHKKVVFLLIALVAQYLADFLFLYKAHKDLYTTAGITDLTYLVAYFLMSLAIINLNSVFEQLKNGKSIMDGGAVN